MKETLMFQSINQYSIKRAVITDSKSSLVWINQSRYFINVWFKTEIIGLPSQFSLTQVSNKTITKTKVEKPLSSYESVKAAQWVGYGLWWEGYVEKARFD